MMSESCLELEKNLKLETNESSDDGEVSSSCEEEETVNLEEGECPDENVKKKNDLEEGEVSDEGQDAAKPICRFFGKGLCTWGQNCRFLHPGVPDKGLYTMFEPKARPPPPLLIPSAQPLAQTSPQPLIKTGLLGHAPPNYPQQPYIHVPSGPESSWERGQRHAKEIIKASVKRKETDVDFEEKKMNLSLAQDEIDKENDYYVVRKPEPEISKANISDGEDELEENLRLLKQQRLANKIDPDFVRNRVHRIHSKKREAPPLHNVVHEERRNIKDDGKKETWHDPWMRANQKKSRSSSSSSSSNWEEEDQPKQKQKRRRNSSVESDNNKKRKKNSSESESDHSTNTNSSFEKNNVISRGRATIRKAPPRDDVSGGQGIAGQVGASSGVRIAPPLPSNEFEQHHHHHNNQSGSGSGSGRGGGGNMRGRFRYAPAPSQGGNQERFRNYPPQNQPRYNNTRYQPSQNERGRRSPPQSQPQQPAQNRYYKRSKFSRDRSSSSNSSVSGNSSDSSTTRRRRRIQRQRTPKHSSDDSSEDDSDSSSSIELPRRQNRGVVQQQKKSPPPVIEVPMATQKKSQIKLTLTNKSSLKDNKNIVDKLDDDDIQLDATPPQIIPESKPIEMDSDSESSDKDVKMHQKLMQNLDRGNTASKSRREELLKQLKAVEEAIAKKRSKIEKHL